MKKDKTGHNKNMFPMCGQPSKNKGYQLPETAGIMLMTKFFVQF